MPDVDKTVDGEIGEKTVDGVTVYYPITEMYTSDGKTAHTGSWYACFPIFKNALQIIDYANNGTGDAVEYNQQTVTKVNQIPSTLKAVNPTTAFLYSMNATNYAPPTDPSAVSGAVCYTSNKNGLTASNTRKEENTVAEYTYKDNVGKIYYYYIGYHCAEQTSGSSSCVADGTLVTLANGVKKPVEKITASDQLLVWDFFNGKYTTVPATVIVNHGNDVWNVISLMFSDGTKVDAVTAHAFFDMDLNKFVLFDDKNVSDYIGHKFMKADGNSYTEVELVDYKVEKRYTGSYSLVSAKHYNFIVEDMISLTNSVSNLLAGLEVGENMKYDQKTLIRDIMKYGVYDYKDFSDYVTEEQFMAFNGPFLKISVGKGYITYEEIVDLILRFVNPNH